MARKHKKNFTSAEAQQLCNSLIAISNDPIIGSDQKSELWTRVTKHFHKILPANYRSKESTKSRWQQINKTVGDYLGCM
jgi:hypothetical protein